jgi:hypothetical protein
MRLVVGTTPGERGDGIVEDWRCRIQGVPHVTLPDVLHGVLGGPWYGDEGAIDRWWPSALDCWREALAARVRQGDVIEPVAESSVGVAVGLGDAGVGRPRAEVPVGVEESPVGFAEPPVGVAELALARSGDLSRQAGGRPE